ncbi:MAG TPA: hypothetical protein DIV86_03545 [Alphaproteobacteria bacterium]|nr:hypothetical protein [Alphaproteobacteria bacterium]
MLSRVAESLYWVSRYIERAENVARIIEATYNFALDGAIEEAHEQWAPLILSSGIEGDFSKKYGDNFSKENVVHFLIFDEDNVSSIWSCMKSARFNARALRPVISPEMWEELNYIYHYLQQVRLTTPSEEELKLLFEKIIRFSHQFVGLTSRTILRDEGWRFIKMGRLLERADQTSRVLDVKYFILLPSVDYVNTPYDDIQWGSLLKSASAFEPYRRKHNSIEYDKIIDFLVLDKSFPRSIRFCVDHALEIVKEINKERPSEALRKTLELSKELENKTVHEIKFYGLHEYLDLIQQKLNDIGDAIYRDYFNLM